MSSCLLRDRAILTIRGDDAEAFLNRMVTNSMLELPVGMARYAALLSPQGKLLHDFLVFRRSDAFWIDCPRDQAADLVGKLTMFKLRAKVVIENRADDLAVAASWDGALMEAPGPAFRDPRHDGLGYRIVATPEALVGFDGDAGAYEAHRIALGIPKGGVDFVYGDTFAHDANMDLLHGVDFDKGCYVGQEVVSRVHHRNSARKRVVAVRFYGHAPAAGADLAAGSVTLGQLTSTAGDTGLATVRIDRLAEAEEANIRVLAGGTLVGITLPARSTVTAPTYADGDAVF